MYIQMKLAKDHMRSSILRLFDRGQKPQPKLSFPFSLYKLVASPNTSTARVESPCRGKLRPRLAASVESDESLPGAGRRELGSGDAEEEALLSAAGGGLAKLATVSSVSLLLRCNGQTEGITHDWQPLVCLQRAKHAA